MGNKMLKFLILIVFCFFPVAATAQNSPPKDKAPDRKTPPVEKKANERPAEIAEKEPFAKTDVKTMAENCVRFQTEKGLIEIEMFPEAAPETVRNFLNLAAIGAFDGTTFSRVVPGFVIQGGNLYTNEKITNELARRSRRTVPDEPNQIKHERGIVSMARGDEPNTATTDFFILLSEAAYLDGKFAAFGRIVKGIETVEEINKMPVKDEKPENPVRILKAAIAPCQNQAKTSN